MSIHLTVPNKPLYAWFTDAEFHPYCEPVAYIWMDHKFELHYFVWESATLIEVGQEGDPVCFYVSSDNDGCNQLSLKKHVDYHRARKMENAKLGEMD